ncbi:hypothetical protein CDL15_Pgr008772 [Punica granatum]|nr:hypothetical protein CDL15_Pgr008772 [Punica granatum]PKI43924.1 hypothetical protein CRG98_035758 [Punica granatum]
MESAQENEDCHSSESGWTMYIGSPAHDDDDDDDDGNTSKSIDEEDEEDEGDDEDGSGNNKNKNGHQEDEETDDSMASDASSGPSYYRELNVPRGGECSSRHKKASQVQEEVSKRSRGDERRRPAKEEADRSETGSKVRKNWKFQMGKRK